MTAVESEVNNYHSCMPNVKGIMFDEMPNGKSGFENYYGNLTKYVHANESMTYSFGNPGADTNRSYQGKVDLMDIYEDAHNNTLNGAAPFTNSTLQGNAPITNNPPNWHTLFDKSTYSFIQYNKTRITQQGVQNESVFVGLMYFTNDTGCGSHSASYCIANNTATNPYATIASYLGTMAGYLNNLSINSMIQAQDTSGHTLHIPIQIYQSGNLTRNGTTPFTY